MTSLTEDHRISNNSGAEVKDESIGLWLSPGEIMTVVMIVPTIFDGLL